MDVYKDWLGIPEESRPPNHYELLRLRQFEDDAEKIRGHYKKLNVHVRAYASGQYADESQNLLNELARAMLCLTDPSRKREYDESLGREFEDTEAETGRKPLLRSLVETGHLSREQVREVKEFADARGLGHRDAVVQMKLADQQAATAAFAVELGLPFIDLTDTFPDDSVMDRVPRNLVKRHTMIPLFIDDDTLLVACADEPSAELEDDLRIRFGLPMRAVLAAPLAINQGISRYYAPGMRDEAVEVETAASGEGKSSKSRKKASKSGKKPAKKGKTKLSEGERAQRKQLGILFMCWSIIGAVLLDQMVLRSSLYADAGLLFFPTAIIPAAVIFWVTQIYWK